MTTDFNLKELIEQCGPHFGNLRLTEGKWYASSNRTTPGGADPMILEKGLIPEEAVRKLLRGLDEQNIL